MGFLQLAVVVCLFSCTLGKVSFEGHKLASVVPTNPAQMSVLDRIIKSGEPYLDFWTFPALNKKSTIRVPPESYALFSNQMQLAGMPITLEDGDVETYLEKAKHVPLGPHDKISSYKTWVQGTMVHDQYYDYTSIQNYLQDMQTNYPALVKEVGVLDGVTAEGRQISFIRIGSATNKPVIIIESLIHAREWIAGASVLYTLDRLLTRYAVEIEAQDVLDNFELIIIPVANPDGYEYSRITNRLWRKNRSFQGSNCYGVDLNRNFAADFGNAGVSHNCRSETYCGTSAFSEQESEMIRKKVMEYGGDGGRLLVYLAVHSYSQLLLTPFSFNSSKPSNWAEIESLAATMNDALSDPHGAIYYWGHGPVVLYPVSGASDDWAMLGGKARYVYTYELRPSTSSPGFQIVADPYVRLNGYEFWNSIVAMARNINYT